MSQIKHLSDAEFSLLLDGAEPGFEVAAHLAACQCCREELQIVQDSLGSFRSLSTTWAEVEAPRRMPLPARWLHRSQGQVWSRGLAATAMAGALVFWLGFGQQQPKTPTVHTVIVAPSNAELAEDNQLLQSIDTELSDGSQPFVSVAAERGERQHNLRQAAGTASD
jgi:anti-sigma factor RsiW